MISFMISVVPPKQDQGVKRYTWRKPQGRIIERMERHLGDVR